MKTALICGVSGQDGAYLARLLLDQGYRVVGASRDVQAASFSGLEKLGVRDKVSLISLRTTDFRSILQALSTCKPDEIYNLSGQSSVGLSFEQPVETLDSVAVATVNLLEAIRYFDPKIRFYNAGSSECFGDTSPNAADEDTPFSPRSPYAVAKAAAHWVVRNYREAYGMFASNGVLFNHESPLRGDRFVTSKIVAAAVAIKRGEQDRLGLANLDISRDWGWAPEYVDAMHRVLQADAPGDFVIATGKSHSLEDFVAAAFATVDLDWRDHVDVAAGERRPLDIAFNQGNPARARRVLGWEAKSFMPDVVRMMVEAKLGA